METGKMLKNIQMCYSFLHPLDPLLTITISWHILNSVENFSHKSGFPFIILHETALNLLTDNMDRTFQYVYFEKHVFSTLELLAIG